MEMDTLRLRPFEDSDVERMRAWLAAAHVRQWYHEPEDWLEEIRQRHGAFGWIHHFIVIDGERPVGFGQYYDCYNAGDMEDWYTADARGQTYSIDYLIGDEADLGKGYGKTIVKLLTGAVKDVAGGGQIVVQPEAENQASCGVLLANGYVFDAQKGYYCKEL